MISGLLGRTHQRDALILDIRESHRQRLVDENGVTHDVPGLRQLVRSFLGHPDRAELGKGPKLRAGSGSTLQPNDKRDSLIGHSDAMRMGSE